MRFLNQSTAVMFLITVLSVGLWPSLDVVAQDSSDPFGPPTKQDSNPFGGSAAEAKPTVKPAQVARPAQPVPRRRRSVPIAKPTYSSRTLQSMRIRETLAKKVDLVYDAEPFGDIRHKLASDLGINIVIDANLEGILDDNTEVSANLAGVALADGLRTMLRMVDATYTIKEGALLIISIDDETEPDYMTRHMIDVRELLRLIKITESDRIGKPVASTARSLPDGGKGGGGGVFRVGPQAEEAVTTTAAEQVAAAQQQSPVAQHQELLTAERILTDGICTFVTTDAWTQNGGGNCELTCIGGVLIVASSEKVAQEVTDFVTDLEYGMKNPKE